MGHITLVSSANFNISPDIFRSMSFIYIRNKHGPNTDPCDTPLNTQSEVPPFKRTRCFLSVSHLLIHSKTTPCMPWAFNFISSLLCGTVSNALAKSKYKVSTHIPLSTCFVTFSRYANRFVKHDLPGRNPC